MIVAIGFYEYLGVDIETWDKKIDYHLSVANQCFAEAEKSAWLALPDHKKPAMFYQLWTRKESFVKATGTGITLDVSQVIILTENAAHFVSIPASYGTADDWKLVDLHFPDGISGALTVKANDFNKINVKSLTGEKKT
jgi:4'-phosphopantetheinyl transferase